MVGGFSCAKQKRLTLFFLSLGKKKTYIQEGAAVEVVTNFPTPCWIVSAHTLTGEVTCF